MEPLPNWRSTADIASSIAFSFSGFTAISVCSLYGRATPAHLNRV